MFLRHRLFTVCMAFALYCRAGVYARRTDGFLNFNNVRRGQDPALQTGANAHVPRKPRAGQTPAGRHICLPYKHSVARTRTKKRCHNADVHGYQTQGKRQANRIRAAVAAALPAVPCFFAAAGRATTIFHFYFLIFHFFSPALHKTARGTRLYK